MKKIISLFLCLTFLSSIGGYADTRNIVPRGPGEGSIGTSAKPWGDGWFDDLHVDGNSIFSNLEGTNGVAIIPTESGASVGLDTNALTSLPKFLKWDGTNIVWDNKFDIPEGMDVPAYLASLNVPNFMQQQSVEVPGVVASIYENNPGEELVSEVNFGTRELGRFDLEKITGPSKFIVSETNGYYGQFNETASFSKVKPGVCIVIDGQYYPIADITDEEGSGTYPSSVKISLPLVPGTTNDVEGYSGISSGEGYSRLSYAFDPDGGTEKFRAEPSTWYITGWCCTPDFKIHYLASWHYIFKSTDSGKTWYPVCRIPEWYYGYYQNVFSQIACSPDGESVLVSQSCGRDNYIQNLQEGSFRFYTTNGFKTYSQITKIPTGANVKDIYCAGSNRWGSITWVISVYGDYAASSMVVSTNNGQSWEDWACIAGNINTKSIACDPDLTTVAYTAGNNSRTIIVGELTEPNPTATFSTTTSYTVPTKTPYRLKFELAGEFGEFVNTNIIYALGIDDGDVRLDASWYIHYLNRQENQAICLLNPVNERTLQLQPLLSPKEIAFVTTPDRCKILKTKFNIEQRLFNDTEITFQTSSSGAGWWRYDSEMHAQGQYANDEYQSLSINQTRPNVWYMKQQPYRNRFRISQDYGTTWKSILFDSYTLYSAAFAIAGLDNEFIMAWPINNQNNMKYDDSRYKSLVLADNDFSNYVFVDGTPFKFYDLSWPASNKLYAIVECGYVLDEYQNMRLAISEDKGKTWYFPGGPNHAYAYGIYAQSYIDDVGDTVTNVMVTQMAYRCGKRPWLWNSKTDKWTSVEPWYASTYDWDYYDIICVMPARLYGGGNGFAATKTRNTDAYCKFWRTTNSLLYGARQQKYFATPSYEYSISKNANPSIVDDPVTGEEIWYFGGQNYSEKDWRSKLTISRPDKNENFVEIQNSPTGRYERVEAVTKNIIWCSISTNAASRWNVWKTTDGGETWTNTTSYKRGLPLNSETGSAYFGSRPAIWPVDENICWIAFDRKFYETTDGGDTWTYKGPSPTTHGSDIVQITGDHANRANTNMIWYTIGNSDSDTEKPLIYFTTNQFETSEPFAWIPKKDHPNGTDHRYNWMTGLYSPACDPETVYSGIYNGWPMVSHDGGATWNYIADPDDPENENQFVNLTSVGGNYGWQVCGHGDTVIYTKVYRPYLGEGYNTASVSSEIFISNEGEFSGKPRKFKKLDIPDEYKNGYCPLAKNGCVYAGNEIILNMGQNICYYNAGPDAQSIVTNSQTMITKTNGIDSARWAQLEEVAVDSLYSKSTKSAVTVLFSFDQGNSYKKYDKLAQAWETVVYKDVDTGTWYFRTERNPGGQDQYGTVQAQSPQASISAAMDYKFNRFSDEEISQVTDLEWNYLGAFDSETTSNMMFSVTFIPAEQYNGKAEVPAIYDVSFKTVMKSDLYTKKDNNYLVTQQEGETSSTVTKTNSAVANSVIYYLRNIP